MKTKHYLGKVFISHTSADQPFVSELAHRIGAEGVDVWLDVHDLLVGDPLAERIRRGANRTVGVFLSAYNDRQTEYGTFSTEDWLMQVSLRFGQHAAQACGVPA